LPYRLWRLVQVGKWIACFGFLSFEVVLFEFNPVAAVIVWAAVFLLLKPKQKETIMPEVKITQETITEPPKVDEIMNRYFELSEIIRHDKDVRNKLRACRASYKILPYFVKHWLEENDELPPTILCRDVGIKLFMRVGQWYNAELAIKTCAAVGALPDDGQAALDYLRRYKKTVQAAVKLIQDNEGFLQDQIYKALPNADQDCLKDFVRSSLLIDKIKIGKTNALYINKRVYTESDFHWRPE